jgi:hypothetical protein
MSELKYFCQEPWSTWDFLAGKIGLGQAKQNCTLTCTYDQVFEVHCTADWGTHGLSIENKSQKMLEDDGNGLGPSFLLVSINVRKQGPLKGKHWYKTIFH